MHCAYHRKDLLRRCEGAGYAPHRGPEESRIHPYQSSRRSPFQHLKDAYALRWKPRPRGVLSASINATTLAFITADIALFDFVYTVSSGVRSTQPLLDLTSLEENDVPLMVLVIPRTGKVTIVTLKTRLHPTALKKFFASCGQGRSQGNAAGCQTAVGRPRSCQGR